MMPSRDEYGSAGRSDNKLVPAALTAYRHFYLILTHKGGVRLTPMTGSDYERAVAYDDPEQGEFKAGCLPFGGGYAGPRTYAGFLYGQEHPTPSLECTCGFYAHYFPDTDFYTGEYWKLMHDATDLTGTRIMVRAVVEMSGRVVAGDLGVRAERMKVKAFAVDWDKVKIRQPELSHPDPDGGVRRIASVHRDVDRDRDEGLMRNVGMVASQGAITYGAKYYGSAAEMYERFPQQDLSALGINAMTQAEWTEERRRKRERGAEEFIKMMSDVGQAIDTSFKSVMMSFGALSRQYGRGPALTHAQLAAIFGTGLTAEQGLDIHRVIQEKKNRPAPPGAGIDRRKRKL